MIIFIIDLHLFDQEADLLAGMCIMWPACVSLCTTNKVCNSSLWSHQDLCKNLKFSRKY